MAAKVATAIRREEATKRISESCAELGQKFGVEPGDLFPRHKHPDIERAIQLESIADFLSQIVAAIPEKPTKPTTRKRKPASK